MEDSLIIKSVKNGDVEAFARLVEKYHENLLTFIYRLVRDEKIVEDIGQDVFLYIYKSLRDFDENRGTPFSAWLFIAARNRCISELRKRSSDRAVSIEEAADLAANLESVESLLIEHEERRMVMGFVEQLTEPFKAPLIMSLNGSSLKEIARACGVSLGTAKSRLSRAKGRIRVLVQGYLGGRAYERV
jgi:RNA polymerase sigma-70 factor (ECF subfamily)